ncbi:ParB N-terminal domain-containing protein [Streptomyces albidoflavus]|uniref:ParB N-terminal domain-containing protein n=1 Tax=Streptomyces albidoflavus TaxID=1886 RepID=UPI000D15065E|nr:ParB N-terminal domain-containing protein [Streptomyces albidoflavus]
MADWSTLRALQAVSPCKDYDEVLDILEADYLIAESFPCWRSEVVPVVEIDRYQIIDDPDDLFGWRKVGLLRTAFQEKKLLPPLVLVHSEASDRGRYALLDGRHRFNAARLKQVHLIPAWVAHIGCCGGPTAGPLTPG